MTAIATCVSRYAVKWLMMGCVATATLLPLFPAFAAEQRYALVIGNSAYPSAPLRNSVNDANAMAAKLRTLGFDVILRTDANQRDMSRAIGEFGKKLKLGSIGLFYFAGHGMQVRGRNFLIPVDAEIESEGAVRGEAVDVEHVLDQLGAAQLSMVILDACRNNPFETRFRRAGGGLAQIDAPTGSLLAYATAPGKVAADGAGSNGTYTAALLKAIDMPGLKVEDVFKQVRNEVIRESDSQQIPWESSSLTNEFYFRPDGKALATDAKLREAEQARLELQREMEKLRAELLKLGVRPAATQVSLAQQVPTSSPPPIAAAGSQSAQPPATPPPVAGDPAEWAQRLALLENSRGQLTFSKALAILLDINSENELSVLLNDEKEFREMRYSSAYAIGTDGKGNLIWGGTYGWVRPFHATESAIEFCAKARGDRCKVVVINGDFKEKEFLEVAKQLGTQSVSSVRQAFRQNLVQKPQNFMASHNGGGGMSGGYNPSFGFTSLRE